MAKRIRIALIAAAMTLLLAMGSAVVGMKVHAGSPIGGGTVKPDSPTVGKIVNVADGITLPDTTFTFTATQVENADGTTAPAQVKLDPVTIEYKGQTSASTDLTKTATFDLSGITAPGEYTYEVAETNGNATGWTYDTQKYYMQVLVKTDRTKSYTITKTKGDKTAANKEAGFAFTNTYKKNTSLTIKKTVENSTYEPNNDYKFTLTFTNGENADKVTDIDLTKVDGNTGLTKNSDGTYTFTLKNNGSITINGIPVGTKYTIAETKPDGANYKSTKIEQTVNGATEKVKTTGLSTSEAQLIGENTNEADVTNTYQPVTVTGVITQIAPFIAMVAIAGGAVALYIVSRRRRDA
ncbi:MAG: Spy0128 family protein [Pseudoramibacter sp.]